MKRLIIIGNKIIDNNISELIETFDFIVRLNRMNNYGKTGTRTDLYFADIHKIFLKLVEKPYDKYLCQRNIIKNNDPKKLKYQIEAIKLGIFTNELLLTSQKINLRNYKKEKHFNYTNFYKILNYCIENYSNQYEIWITCIDVDGRGKMFLENDIWRFGKHRDSGYLEEKFIKEKLTKKEIFML